VRRSSIESESRFGRARETSGPRAHTRKAVVEEGQDGQDGQDGRQGDAGPHQRGGQGERSPGLFVRIDKAGRSSSPR
jgi:hypothetical protein